MANILSSKTRYPAASRRGAGLPPEKGFCHHVIGLGIPGKNRFAHGYRFLYDITTTAQELIDQLTEGGNLCLYAHPSWSHIRMGELRNLRGYAGMEIYDHVCEMEAGCGSSAFMPQTVLKSMTFIWKTDRHTSPAPPALKLHS